MKHIIFTLGIILLIILNILIIPPLVAGCYTIISNTIAITWTKLGLTNCYETASFLTFILLLVLIILLLIYEIVILIGIYKKYVD